MITRNIMLSIILLLLAFCACAQEKDDKAFTIKEGMLGPSKIMVAVPKKWNKQVLMLAHGLRLEGMPFTAEFTITDNLYGVLLREGWMVASTSYRRNGYLHDEAIEDLDALRQYLIETYGIPEHIYLDGRSMGGCIVTSMAETRGGKYDGALAIGAALNLGGMKYAFALQMPLLFISNQNEMSDPQGYRARMTADAPNKPAVWQVKRDGHCNLNDQEELTALRTLVAWRDTGKIEMEKDLTIVVTPPSVARFHDGGASAVVTGADVDTRFVAVDLEKLGIKRGDYLTLIFKDKTARVYFGASGFDVPQGEWVVYVRANGYVRFSRNYASVREALGCKDGDELFIKAIPKEKAKE